MKCKQYIQYCELKSKKHEFNLQTEVQQVLRSKNIILLKAHQVDQELLDRVDAEQLALDIKGSIMKDAIKMEDSIYFDMATILQGVNEKTNRRTLKIQLNNLYKGASEEDGKIIEVFINLCSKLPNFQRLENIGELELITNFLDPVFSPLFNDPLINKHFIWLNRQEESTGGLRPDGAIISIPKKSRDRNFRLL
jgi:hypothetical protein